MLPLLNFCIKVFARINTFKYLHMYFKASHYKYILLHGVISNRKYTPMVKRNNVFINSFFCVMIGWYVVGSSLYNTTVTLTTPVKIPTPYGGKLIYVLPGENKMIIHLKDKNKIRHRKRWSQVSNMNIFICIFICCCAVVGKFGIKMRFIPILKDEVIITWLKICLCSRCKRKCVRLGVGYPV